MDDLRGRVAVITGGGSGIGRGTALAFAREGTIPVIAEIDAERAAAVEREARELGVDAAGVQCDVTSDDDFTNLRDLIGRKLAAEEGMGESVVLTDNYIQARAPRPRTAHAAESAGADPQSTKSKGTRCGGRWSARLPASHEAVCDRLCGHARMWCAIEESVERVRAQ